MNSVVADGEVVAEFTGTVDATEVEAFLDQVVPSEADRLAAEGQRLSGEDVAAAQAAFEAALELDPSHTAAALGLAEFVVEVLLAAVALRDEHQDDARAALVDLFGVLGDDDRVRTARPRLASALY